MALTSATVRWIVRLYRCSAEHMLGVPLVESNIAMVNTTLVPLACAVRMKAGTGPLVSFQLLRADPPLKSPVQST